MIQVLIVDDDVRVARINAAYVAKVAGFRVTAQAHSAAQALAAVEDVPVDLILLDHYLPDQQRPRRRTGVAPAGLRQVDVIMVTAARDVGTVQDAMRHGALQYLVKPFNCTPWSALEARPGGVRGAAPHARRRRAGRTGRGGPALRRPVGGGRAWTFPRATPPPRPSSSGTGAARCGRAALRPGDRGERGDEPADGRALSEAAGADRQGPADAAVRRRVGAARSTGTPGRRSLSGGPRPRERPGPRSPRAWPRPACPRGDRTKPARQEAERDRDETRVLQREELEVDAGEEGRGGLPDTTG
ncbi:hypothetical protein SMICM17S_08261 [Streptomyces microflavus]